VERTCESRAKQEGKDERRKARERGVQVEVQVEMWALFGVSNALKRLETPLHSKGEHATASWLASWLAEAEMDDVAVASEPEGRKE
jgi:hypothetical protein